MTNEEKKQFDDLYEYVKTRILNYDKNQKLPSSFVLGLRGLSNGKAIDNKKIADKANYSFEVILITFKLCRRKIEHAVNTKNFKSEQSKFAYICKIVESDLNNTYKRMKVANQSQKKIEDVETNNLLKDNVAEYKKRSRDSVRDLNDMW